MIENYEPNWWRKWASGTEWTMWSQCCVLQIIQIYFAIHVIFIINTWIIFSFSKLSFGSVQRLNGQQKCNVKWIGIAAREAEKNADNKSYLQNFNNSNLRPYNAGEIVVFILFVGFVWLQLQYYYFSFFFFVRCWFCWFCWFSRDDSILVHAKISTIRFDRTFKHSE